MKKFILISSLIFLFGCGSRTRNVQKENIETTSQTLGTASAKIDSKTKSETSTNTKLVDLGFGFSLTPMDGKDSFINLISGKDTLSLKTNAKVEFNKNNKTQESQTKTIYETITSYWTHTTYNHVTTYKSVKKDSQTERKAFPWYFIVIGSILCWELVRQLINKNTVVSLWNRITKK